MTKKYIISILCILFAYASSLSAQSGYVGEFVYLSAPSVYGTIDGAAWSSNSNKVTVSGDHYGAQVLIHEYFTGSVTVECLYNYSYYSGGKKQYVTSQRAYYTISCLSSKISLNKKEVTLKPWETVELSYTNSSGYELPFSVWTTSDENVAVINSWEKEVYCQQTVEITAKGPGKCKITCDGHCGGAPVTCTINVVSIPPTSISVTPENVQLTLKETANLKYTLEPSDAYAQITWTSSDESVVKVNTSGKITGVSERVATITATTDNGLSASCSVVVKKVAVESLSFISQGELLSIGESKTLNYELLPANASDKSVTWSSDNTDVATVSNTGVVTAKAMGTAVITCTSNDDSSMSACCRIKVTKNAKVKSVAAGANHSLIGKTDGCLWACGWNKYGQIGDGTTTDRHTPVKIMYGVASVAAGNAHSLIIKNDGSLWACGLNDYGQLGDGTTTNKLTPVKIMDDVSSVAGGAEHTLIIKTDGSLWACGRNSSGQLGDGTTTDKLIPVKIMDDVSSVAADGFHSLIVKTDGTLWACGYNHSGQLGDGTTTDRHTPIKIMDGVSFVAAGHNHSLIVKIDGTLWTCGYNYCGQLGDGTTKTRNTPIKIMDDVFSVAGGWDHTLIVKTNGSLWACGANNRGQLGDGTTKNRLTPIKIMDDVSSAAAKFNHSSIAMTDGSLWVCGCNNAGELGDGTTTESRIPKMIMEGYSEEPPIVELSKAGYATFYDSKNSYALPKGLSASVVTSCSNNKLEFKTIAEGKTSNNIVPKGTAVMLVSDNETGGLYTLTQTSDDATYTGTNYLHGSDETTMTSSEGNDYYYKLTYGNGKHFNVFGWYWGNSNGEPFMIEEHRAWLALPKTVATRGFTADGYATGTDEIDIVDETGAIYDLQSRRIMKPNASGIYIKNGKKVLINKTK